MTVEPNQMLIQQICQQNQGLSHRNELEPPPHREDEEDGRSYIGKADGKLVGEKPAPVPREKLEKKACGGVRIG